MVDTAVKPTAAPTKPPKPAKAENVVDKNEKHVRPLKRHARLFAKAVFTGYKRGIRNQHKNQTILEIEGCRRKEHDSFYIGKRCVYVYKAQTRKCVPQHPESIWGKVTRLHGNIGCVRARFNRNLPGHAMGQEHLYYAVPIEDLS